MTASTSGDTLVATVAIAAGSTGPLASVTDSSGGSWTKGPIGFLSGANTRVEMWYRVAAPSVTSATASFASGTTKSLAMSVSEWSGVASASALDVQGNSSGSSATTATSPALTTTNATDVVIGALNYTGSATSTAGGTGFAPLSNFDVSSTHGRASYNVTTTAGSYQASWSLSAASSYGAAALALKAGSTGPTDTTPPTTSITCNSSACSSSAYSAAVQVALSATDSGGSGLKTTYYTTDGSDPTSSASRTAYSSPFTVNTTTTVKYSSVDNANNVENVKSQTITINTDTTPPTTSITCNSSACSSSAYSAAVQVALSATDSGGSGLKTTYYTTDGSDPTSSASRTAYSSPFTVNTTTTVKYSSVDNANNVENVKSQTITINTDTTPPTTSITCNSSACSSSAYSAAVQVALSATDSGGSGLKTTYYTTDGSDPTSSASRTAYSSPFTLNTTTTVKYSSVDNANNVENVKSQTITINTDTTPPTTSITCNSSACSSSAYSATVQVALSATDSGGSGLKTTYYTTDGSDPTSSASRTAYSSPFTLNTTTTVKYSSVDNANNVENVNTQQINVDTTAPTTTATCNGTLCSGTYASNALTVQVLLRADDGAGSGVAATYYSTDGGATYVPYLGGISLVSDTVLEFYSVDNAGHNESTNTLMVTFDSTPPTTTIGCNATGCGSTTYTGPVSVSLSADDGAGSGVSATSYTTDGTDPTSSASRKAYSGSPFTLNATANVRFYSTDNAGNAESVNSQQITIDATAPTTTATCNGFPCSGTYLANGLVQVALTADDQNATIHYTTDGSTPTTSSPAYAFPIDVAATETIKYFAIDTSNNSENVNTLVVMIDGSAPTTTITCNAATCSSSAYTSAVTVALSATDTGGSGVDKTYYTTDGSPPTTSSTTYTSPFSVSSTTTVRFFSTDKAGNAESPGSQTITITSGGGGGGTIALQRQATASSSASVGSLTVSIPATTTGDALVAAIAVQAASTGPINTVTDSAGGTWTRGPTGSLTGSNTRIELWYRLNASSVTSVTASFASGTSKPLAINLTEWSGVASASAADGQTNGTGTSTTAAPPALTTTNASDVVFGAINFSSTSASSGAPSGGFIALNDFNMSTSHGRAAYKIVSTAGSYQPTWTLSVSSPFGAAALALKSS